MRSSSPRSRSRPHTAPSDLSTARPLSTRPVRPSPVLCTRSPTHAMILVIARHAAPTTCTSRDKQTRFSKRNKGKRKTKGNYPGFKFKPHQVNDSSQSNQGTDHLVSHMPNPSAQPVNHFHNRTTIEGSAPTFVVSQQTTTNLFGQGYTQTACCFSMPNIT
jgi:hypothetical protein